MNPIDHPHGGGEGRTKGGRHPVSPSGQAGQRRSNSQEKETVEFSHCATSQVETLWSVQGQQVNNQ